MVEDKSIRETVDEQRADAGGASEEFADAPKRTSVWRGVVRVIGEVAVNLLIGGLPFFAAGVFLLSDDDMASQAPRWTPWAVILIGAAIVVVGFSLSLIARPELDLTSGEGEFPDERVLEKRRPSMKPPFARIAIGVLSLAGAGWLLWFTFSPYIVPAIPFLFGMYMYIRGVVRYWINHHTAYYVTNYRVAWRYLWLDGTDLPNDSLNSASPTRNLLGPFTRTGNVKVTTGIGSRQNVHMYEIDDPKPVERTINRMIAARQAASHSSP